MTNPDMPIPKEVLEAAKQEKHELSIETEIKLAVLKKSIENIVTQEGVEKIDIEQTYLDPKKWEQILDVLKSSSVDAVYLEEIYELLESLEEPREAIREATVQHPDHTKELLEIETPPSTPRNIRVRRSTQNGETQLMAAIKGPRNEHLSRVEIEFPVDEALANELLATGTIGSLKKTRYRREANVMLENGSSVPVHVEIDDMHEAKGKKVSLPIAFVEVEFNATEEADTDTQRARFLAGHHDADWLPAYKDVSNEKAFAMKQMAVKGVKQQDATKVVDEIWKPGMQF